MGIWGGGITNRLIAVNVTVKDHSVVQDWYEPNWKVSW